MQATGRQVARGLTVAGGSVVGLVVVVAVFVSSAAGQRIDETSYQGGRIGRWRIAETAFSVLGLVSVAGIIAAAAATVMIAASRRRLDLGIAALVLVGGANVTTQVLKLWVVDRPDLGIETSTLNSLPSGHATVAASLAVALLLVVPRPVRAPVAWLGMGMTTITGIATLAVGWHRPSDVVAAILVVAAWTGAVVAGLVVARSPGRGAQERAAGRLGPGALLVLGAIALAGSALAFIRTAGYDAIPTDRSDLFLAYAGGSAGVLGSAAALFGVALVLAPDGTRAGRAKDAPLSR